MKKVKGFVVGLMITTLLVGSAALLLIENNNAGEATIGMFSVMSENPNPVGD